MPLYLSAAQAADPLFCSKATCSSLPRTIPLQSWRITSWHFWIVHGLAVSWIVNIYALNPVLLVIPAALIWPGVVFAPIAAALAGLIAFMYYFAEVLEDQTQRLLPKKVRSKNNAEEAVDESRIRFITGWFSDLGRTRDEVFGTLGFPQRPPWHYVNMKPEDKELESPAAVSFFASAGGDNDAGFLTLAYGLQVFALALALAPVTCYGVWLVVGFYGGTTTLAEIMNIVAISYSAGW